jgi:hypothetical protein
MKIKNFKSFNNINICPLCNWCGPTSKIELRYAVMPNTCGLKDVNNVDWKCPKCGCWITADDENETE